MASPPPPPPLPAQAGDKPPLGLGKSAVWYLGGSYALLGHTDLAIDRFGVPDAAFDVAFVGSAVGLVLLVGYRLFRFRPARAVGHSVPGSDARSRHEVDRQRQVVRPPPPQDSRFAPPSARSGPATASGSAPPPIRAPSGQTARWDAPPTPGAAPPRPSTASIGLVSLVALGTVALAAPDTTGGLLVYATVAAVVAVTLAKRLL